MAHPLLHRSRASILCTRRCHDEQKAPNRGRAGSRPASPRYRESFGSVCRRVFKTASALPESPAEHKSWTAPRSERRQKAGPRPSFRAVRAPRPGALPSRIILWKQCHRSGLLDLLWQRRAPWPSPHAYRRFRLRLVSDRLSAVVLGILQDGARR